MRVLKISISFLALALFSLSSCNTTNGLQKRMKNKTKRKCDCPGWSKENITIHNEVFLSKI